MKALHERISAQYSSDRNLNRMKPILNPYRLTAIFAVFAICSSVAGAAILRVVFRNERPEKIMVERRLTARDNPYSYYFFRDTANVTDSIVKLRFNISQPYEVSVRRVGSDRPGSRWVPMGPDDEISLTVDTLIEEGRYDGTEFIDSLHSFARQQTEFLKLNKTASSDFREHTKISDRFRGQFALAHSDDPIAVNALAHASDSVKAAYFDLLDPALEHSVVANDYIRLRNRVRDIQATNKARLTMTVGKIMPDFALPDSTGHIISLSSMRGDWVLIDFWATWCGICIRGFSDLRQFSAECGDRCKVVTVDIDDQEMIWHSFMSRHDMPWINLLNDPTNHTDSNPAEALGIDAIPVTMLIDPDGKIAALQRGAKPGFLEKVRQIIGINPPSASPF